MLLLVTLFCCTPVGSAPPEPTSNATPIADPVVAAPAIEVPAAEPPSSSGDLLAACHDRMELPEADGECRSDADCGTIGCGGEVCAKAGTTGLMFTCEDRPCFHVVEGCGCHDGRCTWSLKEGVPERRMILKGVAQ